MDRRPKRIKKFAFTIVFLRTGPQYFLNLLVPPKKSITYKIGPKDNSDSDWFTNKKTARTISRDTSKIITVVIILADKVFFFLGGGGGS